MPIKNTLSALVVVLGLAHPANAVEQPNVIVILADDQGWGDLSLNGNQDLSTPHIDSLAREGASFERFFVCPVCSPTRAEFLTGRYHPRGGVFSTSSGGERLDLDETTIAEIFQAAGFATGAFGKWHNGMQYPYHPNGRGFDEFYGFCSGHWGDYFDPMLEHNGQIVEGQGFCADDFTNRAIGFIEQNKHRPFFVYLPYNTPHSPMQVPDRWWEKFEDKNLTMHPSPGGDDGHTRAALAMCENIDWNVGRLLDKLDEWGIAENTIVIYFSDNGPNGDRWNGGMRGRKGSTDEGGVRSPLLVRWPAQIQPGTHVKQISAAIDLLPTLADLCGVELVGRKPLDGVTLRQLLLRDASLARETSGWPDRMIFSHWDGRVSVRTQSHRLDHTGRLYGMQADPGQRTDISEKHPEITKRLQSAVANWRKDVLAELERGGRPLPIGHADFRYAQLPARDARAYGEIERSNRSPNCSYFTHWKTLDDKLTWDVEVLEAGDYEVEIYYTCPAADVGSTIELSLGKSRLSGKITRPHDPPPSGAEHDRVPRRESYVKDFRPLKLGTIHLDPGRGELTLRATEIPGSQVADFRLLMLTRAAE